MARRNEDEHVSPQGSKRGSNRQYSRLGKRIAALGKRQRDIARVLGVSQQTVSKKLLGQTGISVVDLEMLAVHYGVPMTYFFEDWTPPKRKLKPKRRRRGG